MREPNVWNASDSFVPELPGRRDVPIEMIGGLPIAVISLAQSARLMIDIAAARRNSSQPALVFTSANGQVLSLCAQDPKVRKLFLDADVVHADGMPLVFASRWLCRQPLPERVATTDLFHDVARLAEARGATFYLLGATDAAIKLAVRRISSLYPRLRICGHRSGYFASDQEAEIVAEINAASPDILWIGMGARASNPLRYAIAPACTGWNHQHRGPVRFSFRPGSRARAGCRRGSNGPTGHCWSHNAWPAAT